jgi:hypothetical protein
LRIGVVPSCQKLDIDLVILKNQKMSITKNVLLNCYFLMKRRLRKIRMISDIEN